MAGYWLVSHGDASGGLKDDWTSAHEGLLRTTWFPRRARIEAGDCLVYYAVGWQCIHGAVEALSPARDDLTHPGDPERWPWGVEVEPLLVMPTISMAPKLELIGVSLKSVRRQSHIRISQENFESAVELLVAHGATGRLAGPSG